MFSVRRNLVLSIPPAPCRSRGRERQGAALCVLLVAISCTEIPPMSDDRIGKYELQTELGRGGFAAVYRARGTALDREGRSRCCIPATRWTRPWCSASCTRRAKPPDCATPTLSMSMGAIANGQPYIAMKYLPGEALAAVDMDNVSTQVWYNIHVRTCTPDGCPGNGMMEGVSHGTSWTVSRPLDPGCYSFIVQAWRDHGAVAAGHSGIFTVL